MDFDAQKERRRIDKKIASIRERESVPHSLIELVDQTLDAQLKARSNVQLSSSVPDPTDTARQLQGAPLLERSGFPLDTEQSDKLFYELLDILASLGTDHAEAAATIRQAMDTGKLDLKEVIAAFLGGDDGQFLKWAEKTPKIPRALSFLTIASITPSIETIGASLAKQRKQDVTWAHGHCPVCGSPPLIARLLEKEGYRFLTCSFCHTEYRVKRLQCPYCCEEDATKLKYFEAKEEPGYQVHVCDGCNMYIKTADFRNLERPSYPLLDDLDSMAMDILAQQEGYLRPTLSAWGF